MQRTSKSERLELYKNPDVQAFLNKLLSGEISELEPVYDLKAGYRYPLVETILGDASKVEPFLNKLFMAGILTKRLHDKTVHCPNCGSADVSVHYCCPYCKSFNIQRSALIEHVKCGYMDVEENFKKNDKLVCPKCHEELRKADVDYRKAGTWCTCKECEKSFDIPVVAHFCRECHTNFTFEEATIKDAYIYSLKEQVKEEVGLSWFLITPIKDFLVEAGFTVETNAFLKGKSGANHMFHIIAYKGGTKRKITVIDLAISTEEAVTEQPVIALFAKIFDVSPENAYLIAIPKINENGKKMAELYNITVVEAHNQKEVIKSLKNKMKLN